VFPLLTF